MEILSPAKLNIRLKVIGRRPDGYHELVSLMVPIHLYDHIELDFNRTPGITLHCQGCPVPENEENLVLRAAQAFFSRTGRSQNLSIKLTKKIPVSAGLGGGSSNAASTLKALNIIASNPLSFQDLEELAVSLGADVPFFLHNRPCIARGIGEILEPVKKWPKYWYVIVKPPLSVSTAWAYGNLGLTTPRTPTKMPRFSGQIAEIVALLDNDLEAVTASRFPEIDELKTTLIRCGALGALMSGSGPTVFGVFDQERLARDAAAAFRERSGHSVFVTRAAARTDVY